MENKLSVRDTRGYNYRSANTNEDMVEFHVDEFDLLHEHAEALGFGAFGGN
jgi:hypothetical protein